MKVADELNELEYSREWTNPEDLPSLGYSRTWESRDNFPTIATDETVIRTDMQCLFDEIKDYINGPLRQYFVDFAGQRVAFDDLTPEQKAEIQGEDGFSPTAAVSKTGGVSTITITDKNGTTTAEVHDGDVEFSDLTPEQKASLKGDPGDTGVGITDVEKTGTSGLIDTYTITLSNGETSTFTVTNGRPGDPGVKGDDGEDGTPGAQGAPGIKGVTFTPHIDNGVLTWTNDGGLPNPSSQEILTQLILDQALGSISLEVSRDVQGQEVYASITLHVGENAYTGQIKLDGNVIISGQLSAEALYASHGDIADLQVDKLSTSRRIVKFLAGDKSDDNYLKIVDEKLAFVSSVVRNPQADPPDTEQAVDPYGAALYWESDPTAQGVVIGSDGYPWLNGSRIFTTTTNTGYQVKVFQYDELVKASFEFQMIGGYYTPVLTLGAGDQNGNDKTTIVKRAGGLELLYKTNAGNEIGLKANRDGYLDLLGLRKVTAIDFSRLDVDSTFSVTMQGGISVGYSCTKDGNGNITQISGGGASVPISW